MNGRRYNGPRPGGYGHVYINRGGCCGSRQPSDFGAAFLISWNRNLDDGEMAKVSKLLMQGVDTQRLRVGATERARRERTETEAWRVRVVRLDHERQGCYGRARPHRTQRA